jgi:hypothetical protein
MGDFVDFTTAFGGVIYRAHTNDKGRNRQLGGIAG